MGVRTTVEKSAAFADLDVDGIRAALNASQSAYEASAEDRQRLVQSEANSEVHDTSGDIELLAGKLNGYASWVLEGIRNPALDEVVNDLRSLATTFRGEWVARLNPYPALREYLSKLDQLREVLLTVYSRD
jgi:hypothetical protein